MEYKCVECGFPIKTLFIQYSPGNIRLMKCENCRAVADEYIECEFMIVLIDMILHKPKAYRHVLFNVLNLKAVHFEGLLWKLIFGFLLLDGYRSFLLYETKEEGSSFTDFTSLVCRCQKALTDVFVGNLVFLGVFLVATRIFLNISTGFSRCKDILLAVLVSNYVKIFLLSMMVWEFPSSVIFVIELFVLSSNIVALKVISESDLDRCICTCSCAFVAKLLVSQLLNLRT